MKLINCTMHNIVLTRPDGTTRTIMPSGICPRFDRNQVEVDPIDGFPVFEVSFGELQNLPPARPGFLFIVSSVVANAVKDRNDLLIPFTQRGTNQSVTKVVGFSKISQESTPEKRPQSKLECFASGVKIWRLLNVELPHITCKDNTFCISASVEVNVEIIAKLTDLGWEYDDENWSFSF